MNNDYNTLQILRRLNHVKRCARYPLVNATTVAEHSYHATVLALYIAEGVAYKLDIEKVLRRVLLHDTEEALLSDIPHDVKAYLDTKGALRALVQKYFQVAPLWFRDEMTKEHDGSIEHDVAKLADHLELALYCVEEINTGNRHLRAMLCAALGLSTALNTRVCSTEASNIIKECAKYADEAPR